MSLWHWINDVRILFDKSLSRRLKKFSTLHRSSNDSLIDLIRDSLSLMLKHRLRHVRYRDVRLLWCFISINWPTFFLIYRPHTIWWYGPWPCERIWVFREWSHRVSNYPPLHGLIYLVLKVLIWPLWSLCVANEPWLNSWVPCRWYLVVVVRKCKVLLLLYEPFICGISGRRPRIILPPVSLLLVPFLLWSIIGLLNTDVRWCLLILILRKVIRNSLSLSFSVYRLKVLELALI